MLVLDCMTRAPECIAPEATLGEAARLMVRLGHRRLPVTQDGRLVGIVTKSDVLGASPAEIKNLIQFILSR